jgi:hypothetical protein
MSERHVLRRRLGEDFIDQLEFNEAWLKISKRVFYPESGFREWLHSLERRPVRARGEARP